MESLLTAVADYLTCQSWQVAVVFLLVAAACFGLRRATHHWRYLLWLVVLAKCLTPGFISLPLAVLPHQAKARETPERLSAPVAMAEPHEIHLPTTPAAAEPETATAAAPRIVAATATGPREIAGTTDDAAAKASTMRNTDPRPWWAAAWCSGMAIFIAYALAKAWATNRKLRRTRLAAEPRIAAKVAVLAQRLGVKSVPAAYMVEAVAQPFVWGWLRGSIYVPRQFLTTGTNEQQEAIFSARVGPRGPLGCGRESAADRGASPVFLPSAGVVDESANPARA